MSWDELKERFKYLLILIIVLLVGNLAIYFILYKLDLYEYKSYFSLIFEMFLGIGMVIFIIRNCQ